MSHIPPSGNILALQGGFYVLSGKVSLWKVSAPVLNHFPNAKSNSIKYLIQHHKVKGFLFSAVYL